MPAVSQRNALLICAAMGALLGCLLAPYLVSGWWPWLLVGAALLAGAALIVLKRSVSCAVLVLTAALSLLNAQASLHPARPAEGTYTVNATVYGAPTLRAADRMSAELCSVTLDGVAQSGHAYCTLYADASGAFPALFDGASVRFSGRVYTPSGKENEYDFDFNLWLLQNGMTFGITGVKELSVLNTPQTAPWTDVAQRIRDGARAWLTPLLGEQTNLGMALLLGDRDGLGEEEQQAFRTAGVAHVMVVSGLHVGMLAFALQWLLRKLRLGRRLQFPLIVAFLVAYCAVTGFAASSVRASIMFTLALLAGVLGLRSSLATTASAALLLILAFDPLQARAAGFVLTFSAVGGFVLFGAPLRRAVWRMLPLREHSGVRGRRKQLRQWLYSHAASLLTATLAAQLGTVLPVAAYFHRIPLYGVLFNLLAVPLATVLVPLLAVTLALSWLPWLNAALGAAAKALCLGLQGLVNLSLRLPYATVACATPTIIVVLACGLIALGCSRFVRAAKRTRFIVAASIAAIALCASLLTAPAGVRYHQFAVGQGDASLIVDGSQTIAIDAGPYRELTDRLQGEGRSLDALVLTHLHLDHADGVRYLLEEGVPIGRAYLPESTPSVKLSPESLAVEALLREHGVPITYLAAGDELSFEQVTLRVLWPERGKTHGGLSANDRSLALLIDLDGVRILNMGDNGELYERCAAVPCDVLKVGHHGSGTSASSAFLAVAQPSVAILTTSAQSPTLPSAETVQRLADSGAVVLRTDETGELTIVPQNGGMTIHTYKARETD